MVHAYRRPFINQIFTLVKDKALLAKFRKMRKLPDVRIHDELAEEQDKLFDEDLGRDTPKGELPIPPGNYLLT